jgi:hypothetical protein
MHEVVIQISDDAYANAVKRARQEGFGSTEIFLSDFIANNIAVDHDDHLFTPDVIAAIDRGAQEVQEGKGMTREEVNAFLSAERAEWLVNHPG